MSLSQLEYQDAAVRTGAARLGKTAFTNARPPDIARHAPRRDKLAEIVRCLDAGLHANRDLYLKGGDERIAWIAPIEDRVADLLVDTDGDGIAQRALDELRDLLGLWMENGWSDRPLAAFYLHCPSGLCAPNVITASGYPRFRHRPATVTPDASSAGLTFNLDSGRAKHHPGAGEVVSRAVKLEQVTGVAMAGQPCGLPRDPKEQLPMHRSYADAASRGRTWRSILQSLEALI